ncbi:MAG: hypothetical protein DHS20C15_14050 [Planctomycetota bacterium]|nr:MAG: hypothetical protein DHS20C15_14050 [Planctomycetota bacterium]
MLLATGCLADRCLDGAAVRALLEELHLDRVLLVAHEHAEARELKGLPAAGVRVPLDAAARGIQLARSAGATRLVLSLSDQAELDATCRQLFALSRSQPGLELTLLTPAAGPLAAAEPLALLFEDLAGQGVGYWHRPAQVQALGLDPVDWLDRLGRFVQGASIDDLAAGELGLPPGLGELDLARTAALLGRRVDIALDTDPLPEPALLGAALASLRVAGFP